MNYKPDRPPGARLMSTRRGSSQTEHTDREPEPGAAQSTHRTGFRAAWRFPVVILAALGVLALAAYATENRPTAQAQSKPDRAGRARTAVRFVRTPRQQILLLATAKPDTSDDLERFFKEEFLPVLGRSPEVTRLDTYSGILNGNAVYAVGIEVKDGPATYTRAFNLFSRGRSAEETDALFERFQRYFRGDSLATLERKGDLSIVRDVTGFSAPGKKGE